MNIIPRFPATGILFYEDNNPENDLWMCTFFVKMLFFLGKWYGHAVKENGLINLMTSMWILISARQLEFDHPAL